MREFQEMRFFGFVIFGEDFDFLKSLRRVELILSQLILTLGGVPNVIYHAMPNPITKLPQQSVCQDFGLHEDTVYYVHVNSNDGCRL